MGLLSGTWVFLRVGFEVGLLTASCLIFITSYVYFYYFGLLWIIGVVCYFDCVGFEWVVFGLVLNAQRSSVCVWIGFRDVTCGFWGVTWWFSGCNLGICVFAAVSARIGVDII